MRKLKVEVEATLRDGRLIPKAFFIVCYILFALLLIFTAFAIVAVVIDRDALSILLFPAMLTPLVIWAFVYARKMWKRISTWLEDAVELEAECVRTFGTTQMSGAIKIDVTFTYNGETIRKTSGLPSNSPQARALNGYSTYFTKYENKIIKILYSPKYDEVMMPKQ